MPARRLLAACTAATALLTATAHAAEPPKPAETAPEPRVAAEPKMVVVQAMCYEVVAEVWDEFQKAIDDSPLAGRDKSLGNAWTLTARENRMLFELIRAWKMSGNIDVISRPQLALTDEQTGFFQVSQKFSVVATPVPNGAEADQKDIAYLDTGITLRMTPRIKPDGQVQIRVEAQTALPNQAPVNLGNVATITAINIQEIQTTVELPVGHTAVVATSPAKGTDAGEKKLQTIWQFTVVDVKPTQQADASSPTPPNPNPIPMPVGLRAVPPMPFMVPPAK